MNPAEASNPLLGVASIVIPAHNEQAALPRLLHAILDNAEGDDLEITVVCNGCTDNTARIARSFGAAIKVVETEVPSKYKAMKLGDEVSSCFPRFYVDADIVLTAHSIRELTSALADVAILAVAPKRELFRENTTNLIRWYYDIWERLPQVNQGLFGRGVIGVSEIGFDRIRDLPEMMSDDLAISQAFKPDERRIVESATAGIHLPRKLRDLFRRRIRVATGNSQADGAGVRSDVSRTRLTTLLRLGVRHPQLILKIGVFLGITLIARLGARQRTRSGDFHTWMRDESSRTE